MAPRVIVRQPQGAAAAVGTVPGGGSIQRAWQAARPAPSTSESAMSTNGGLSGHRRRTTDNIEGNPPRSTSPTPSATGGVSAATQAGPAGVDVDRLIEAIEERVLAEIERRGGRYTGLF